MQQSSLAEPIRFAALLTMHDAIELFLCIAAEHLDVSKKELRFMEYWDVLPSKLTQKEAMRRLNQARVDFKHHGLIPSNIDFEGFRVTTALFLEENTLTVFGRQFDSISLVDLLIVECGAARDNLHNAERQLDENTTDAVASCKIAFEQILNEHGRKRKALLGPHWQRNIEGVRYLARHGTIRQLKQHAGVDDPLRNFIEIIVRAVESVEDRVQLLSLGIDGQKYSDFESITPPIRKSGSDYRVDYRGPRPQLPVITKSKAKWCIDFVIEVALNLQGADHAV
jgi:hypothetical protein